MFVCEGCFSKPLLKSVGLLCLLYYSCQAYADTVWMENGDKITGKIESLQAGKLTIVSGYAGVIRVDWAQVQQLESSSKIKMPDTQTRAEYFSRLQQKQGDSLFAASALDQPASTVRPSDALASKRSFWDAVSWRGNLDVDLDYKTASSRTEDYKAKLDTKLEHQQWRHKIKASYARKIDNRVTTSHNYGGRYSADRFLSDQLFWQSRALYKRDHVEDVARQAALGTGLGYQFWDNKTGGFSLAGLVGRAQYRYDDGAVDRFYAASVQWDFNRYIRGDQLEIYTTGEVMRPLNSAAHISIDANVGIRYRVTSWLSWFLNYSRNQITGGRQKLNEKRLSTGLGVTW